MSLYQLAETFCPANFLATYWQKEATVLKQAFIDFVDPLDEHDLAGLAQEEEVDARIISHHAHEWQVTHGPIDDFSDACQGMWSLLVQGVDRFIPDADPLMDAFRFIPYWRMDDLMVSFAVAGAGVGAHTDQYDVFLIQGKGRRRWQVGLPGNYAPRSPHPELSQIEDFTAIIDVTLEPGDVLYIPPGWPHKGTALEDCLTYSVGFRAPDQAALFHLAAEAFSEGNLPTRRYQDPALTPASSPGQVSTNELAALRNLFIDALQSKDWDNALLRLLSDQNLPDNSPEESLSEHDIEDALLNGHSLVRTAACRPIYSDDISSDSFTFFINKEQFSAPMALRQDLIIILSGEAVSSLEMVDPQFRLEFRQLLSILTNKGYWEING